MIRLIYSNYSGGYMELLEHMLKNQPEYLEKFSKEGFKQKLLNMKVSDFAKLLPRMYSDFNITVLKAKLSAYFGDNKLNEIVRNPRQLLECSNIGIRSYKYLERILVDLGFHDNRKLSDYTKEELLKMRVPDFVRLMPEAQSWYDKEMLARVRNALLKEYKGKTIKYVVKNLRPNSANNFGEASYKYLRNILQDKGIYDNCDKV